MQERLAARDIQKREVAWYVARGNVRYGPLASRELMLLVKQGFLRPDDLLWKSGSTPGSL